MEEESLGTFHSWQAMRRLFGYAAVMRPLLAVCMVASLFASGVQYEEKLAWMQLSRTLWLTSWRRLPN